MPVTRDVFAKKMMKALGRGHAGITMHYDAERFALVSDERGQFFLASAYHLYTEAPLWKRGAVIKHYAQAMFGEATHTIPATFDEARGHLVPIIRDVGFLDSFVLLPQTSPTFAGAPWQMPSLPLAGNLCVGLAYDSPATLALVGDKQLAQWNVAFADALKAARYNLSVRSREPMRQLAPGLFMGPWQDANASGRLVLTELLARLPVKGDVVAMAPGRDFLFVTGSDDAAALGALVDAAEKALAAPKSNAPELVRLQGTEWLPFTLPPAHPLAAKHAELVKLFWAGDYAAQKALIDRVYQKNGTAVFVANSSAMRGSDGQAFTYCTWAQCASLLPRTDTIVIIDTYAKDASEPKALMVPWNDAVAIVGHRLQRDESYRLERYLVKDVPTATEMDELRKHAQPM